MLSRGVRTTDGSSPSSPQSECSSSGSSIKKRAKTPENDSDSDLMDEMALVPSGSMTLVSHPNILTRSWEQFHQENLPIEQRYQSAVAVYRFYTKTQQNSMSANVERMLLGGQERLSAEDLWTGLHGLKDWVRLNVHRVLVPPSDPAQRRISELFKPNSMTITVSNDNSGVRSFLIEVCKELRIDLYVVGNTFFQPQMLFDVVKEARESKRALVLLDRPNWFTTNNYATHGAVFTHHLRGIIRQYEVTQRENTAHGLASLTLYNSLSTTSLAEAAPNLWFVVSLSTADIPPDLLDLANGSVCRLHQAEKKVAVTKIRQLLHQQFDPIFAPEPIEYCLSQSNYAAELMAISTLLERHEIGSIVKIINIAVQLAYHRNRLNPLHATNIEMLVPYRQDIEEAIARLNGQALGGVARAMSMPGGMSQAAQAAAILNGGSHL